MLTYFSGAMSMKADVIRSCRMVIMFLVPTLIWITMNFQVLIQLMEYILLHGYLSLMPQCPTYAIQMKTGLGTLNKIMEAVVLLRFPI